MHQHVVILVKAANREQAINAANKFLEPYGDNLVFDAHQIGGRWTGMLTGYEPGKDPQNQEECDVCGGSGFRNDEFGKKERQEDPTYTCNYCGTYDSAKKGWAHGPLGPGRRVKSEWAPVDDDVMPLSDNRVAANVRKLAEGWKKIQLANIENWMLRFGGE